MPSRGGVRAARPAIFVVSLACATVGARYDPTPYLHPQRLVDIGGRRLHLACGGRGTPVVVFDSGLGGTTLDWRLVQSRIAKTTEACAYDRAGMGFSDAATTPRDANRVASDLHALIERARIDTPCVLVAHSIAGLYARAFVARYPSEVAGLVLVDPSTEDQSARFAAIAPEREAAGAAQLALARTCASLAARGALRPGTPAFERCVGVPDPALDAATNAREIALAERPARWNAIVSEFANKDASEAEVRRRPGAYGDLPLVVLTAGNMFANPHAPPGEVRALRAAWKRMHDAIAARSTRGSSLVVPGSGHYIALDRPDAVVSAIARVVAEARASRPRAARARSNVRPEGAATNRRHASSTERATTAVDATAAAT